MKRLLTNPSSLKHLFTTTAFCAACSLAQASDVSSYFVQKGHLYVQRSTATPAEAPNLKYTFMAGVFGDVSAITSVDGAAPSGFPLSFSAVNDGYLASQQVDTLNNLSVIFPSGNYLISIDTDNDGFTPVQLMLETSDFPTTVPHVSNYAQAQSIDPAADFTLTWDAFTDAGPNGEVDFFIEDSGTIIFGATATDNNVVIPAGLLAPETSYTAVLRFVKATQTDTSSYPGATGVAGFYNETQFSILTGSGVGGGTD